MKIAISSKGKELESEIDSRFGRCPYFLIVEVDKESKEIKDFRAIENSASKQTSGAGVTAGETVANEKVDAIITSNMGPRAFQVFEQLGTKIYQGQGNIKDVIKKFLEGKLDEINSSTGPMHMSAK